MSDTIVRRKLFPLLWDPKYGVWTNTAQVPFKPRGLMIWDAPPGAVVVHAIIGINLEIVSSIGPVPARWFSMAQSYEQIAKMLDEAKEPAAWVDWRPMDVGQSMRITLELDGKPVGAPAQLVIWGEEHVQGWARRRTPSLDQLDDRIEAETDGES